MTFLLSARHRQPELMDQPDLAPHLHTQALRGLERINRVSTATGTIWQPIHARLRRRRPHAALSILDVACGAGDTLTGLTRHAQAYGLSVSASGCDVSATAIAYAQRRAAGQGVNGQFFQHDVLAHELPRRFDVVICSLFLHHLDDERAERLLTRLYAATDWLLIVCDLHRCRRGLALAWLGTRLLSRSPIVHADGPRSVRAAFTRAEAASLVERARIPHATIESVWPCRWRLVAERAS